MTAPESLPSGTVTFLFTDIEGSTRLVQQFGERYPELLQVHRDLIRSAVSAEGGREFGAEGDALFIAFASPTHAVAAATAAQRALAGYAWPEDAAIRVRMGLHSGEATLAGSNYVGLDVHRVSAHHRRRPWRSDPPVPCHRRVGRSEPSSRRAATKPRRASAQRSRAR
jgi:class 3 adenylate cyclase